MTYGHGAFRVAGPKLWNEVPLSRKKAPNVNTYKKRSKSYLFKQAFLIKLVD